VCKWYEETDKKYNGEKTYTLTVTDPCEYPVTALVGVVDFVEVAFEEVALKKGTNGTSAKYYVLKDEDGTTMKNVRRLQNEMLPANREEIQNNHKRDIKKKKEQQLKEAFEASSNSKKGTNYARPGKRGYKGQ
jgi:predicted ATP-dependent endonuclease of OLD family